MNIRKAILVINPAKPMAGRTAEALKSLFARRRIRQEWIESLPRRKSVQRFLNDLHDRKADLAIVCGGDGTLLQTAHRLRGSGIPLLGINIGYLGFIAAIESDRQAKEVGRILDGDFVVSERTALDIEVDTLRQRVVGWALNEALITRGDNPHLISLSTRVGQRPLTNYRCDGLLVSTPTGSTAYSLAAGGPIISPECKVLVITPICPQALTNRSVVVDAAEAIEILLAPGSGTASVQADGMKIARAVPGAEVRVTTSKDSVPLAFLPEINYYDILSRKLGWSGDGLTRNP